LARRTVVTVSADKIKIGRNEGIAAKTVKDMGDGSRGKKTE
jgi:hypothetical protein